MAYLKSSIQYEEFYDSNLWGTMQVVDRKPGKLKVRFLQTGYETWAYTYNVVKGKVEDRLAKEAERTSWTPFTEDFVSNSGHKFSAYARLGNKFKVIFERTGYTCVVYANNARSGKVSDPYEISVLGVGYLGEFDKSLPYWRQARQLWNNMMKRCYNPNDTRGYFGECSVSDSWKCFSNFLSDIKRLEGFQAWLSGDIPHDLDKDSKVDGNKVYSFPACKFLPRSENRSLGATNARKAGSAPTT